VWGKDLKRLALRKGLLEVVLQRRQIVAVDETQEGLQARLKPYDVHLDDCVELWREKHFSRDSTQYELAGMENLRDLIFLFVGDVRRTVKLRLYLLQRRLRFATFSAPLPRLATVDGLLRSRELLMLFDYCRKVNLRQGIREGFRRILLHLHFVVSERVYICGSHHPRQWAHIPTIETRGRIQYECTSLSGGASGM